MTGIYKTKKTFERALASVQEHCGKCRYFTCIEGMRYMYCEKRRSMRKAECPDFYSDEVYRSRNSGNAPKRVLWKKDWFDITEKEILYPECPTCGEYADLEEGRCRFCGQPFVEEEDPRPKQITVEIVHEGHVHRLTQVPQYNSLWYSVDGEQRVHTSGSKEAMTEEELRKTLRDWIDTNFPYNLLE